MCLQDFKSWVNEAVAELEKADDKADIRKIFDLMNMLSNKPKNPSANMNTDAIGNLLRSPEDIAADWEQFLSKNFSTTEEHQHPSILPLP